MQSRDITLSFIIKMLIKHYVLIFSNVKHYLKIVKVHKDRKISIEFNNEVKTGNLEGSSVKR